ncbi:MAG: SIS domain-containing protein [Geodermatophilaceae bacterium]|nr:SIS domain-containing protein [Geodermatophilaceae bacterium]MDQ3453887.1 SIS domain-containing protein [Actinomycetota bacterium]
MTRLLDRDAVRTAFAAREAPGRALAGDAEAVAAACHAMAMRFHRGGRLLAFGNGGAATDAAHLAVEFVHPVIVGKRALPAISLTNNAPAVSGYSGTDAYAAQLRLFGRPEDIALGVSSSGRCANVDAGLCAAADAGLLTVALVGRADGAGPDIVANPAVAHVLTAHAEDPRVVKEVHVTIYHVLWELVHVFLEHPGLLDEAS